MIDQLIVRESAKAETLRRLIEARRIEISPIRALLDNRMAGFEVELAMIEHGIALLEEVKVLLEEGDAKL